MSRARTRAWVERRMTATLTATRTATGGDRDRDASYDPGTFTAVLPSVDTVYTGPGSVWPAPIIGQETVDPGERPQVTDRVRVGFPLGADIHSGDTVTVDALDDGDDPQMIGATFRIVRVRSSARRPRIVCEAERVVIQS